MHCFNSVDGFLHRSNCATHAANAELLLQQLVFLLLILMHIRCEHCRQPDEIVQQYVTDVNVYDVLP